MMKGRLKAVFAATSGAALFASPAATALAANGTAAALALGPVTFGAPLALLGYASLPVLWWMMRTTPQKPKEVFFPAMHILFNLATDRQKALRMPIWHKVLRMAVAASFITGLAQPEFAPDAPASGEGPVVMLVGNGWSAARSWDARMKSMNAIIDRAERAGRDLIMLPTAPPADGTPVRGEVMTYAEARERVRSMKPQPWASDTRAALEAVTKLELKGPASAVWLSDGLDDGGAEDLADHLEKMGSLRVIEDAPEAAARLLSPPAQGGEMLGVTVRRAEGDKEDRLTLSARDVAGNLVGTTEIRFRPGETETIATFNLPPEKRNTIERVSIDGEQSAGAVLLLDERWRRRPVGLVSTGALTEEQALLNESTFITRALDPYAAVKQAEVETLVQDELAVMIMTDEAMIGKSERAQIQDWIGNGGTLLRFAGPRLADRAEGKDDLLPVEIRRGERALGSALSGGGVGRIMPFDKSSPFAGIKVPDDVVIERGITAQPGFALEESVWARLADGTPLVTAEQRGKGWIVLVHTTANTDWSNMALSEFFVDMMRAVILHSHGVSGAKSGAPLPPLKLLDGHGRFIQAPAQARPLGSDAAIGPRNPPGFYGNESLRQAHNIGSGIDALKPLPALAESVIRSTYQDASFGKDLSGSLLAGALGLLLADLLANLAQRGGMTRRRKPDAAQPAPDL